MFDVITAGSIHMVTCLVVYSRSDSYILDCPLGRESALIATSLQVKGLLGERSGPKTLGCFIHGPPLLISKGGPCMKQVHTGAWLAKMSL